MIAHDPVKIWTYIVLHINLVWSKYMLHFKISFQGW
jgi:hypothetical protein